MQKITVPTAFNIDLEFQTADFLQRFLAWLIDFIIIVAYFIVCFQLLARYELTQGREATGEAFLYNFSALKMILFTPTLLYHLVCELTLNGQSPGKKIFHLRVISETGGRPALYQFLLRWLVRSVDFGFSSGIAATISYMASKKNQRLGDLAAGTMVIRTKMESSLEQTVFFEVADTYQATYANALLLTDRDMNTIKSMLDRYQAGKASSELISRTADTIRSALNIQSFGDNIEFLETLLKDYNHLSDK